MATRYTDEFRRDAVRIAISSGLTRPHVSSDLGVGLSTLNKWVQQHQHDDLMSGPHEDVEKENTRLCKEVRLLREEREVLKTVPGWGPLVRDRNSLCYRCAMKGRGRSLIGGLSYGGTPLKKVLLQSLATHQISSRKNFATVPFRDSALPRAKKLSKTVNT
jgi:transposase